MKIFNEPNITNKWKCPLCKTSDIKPVTFITIMGTEDEDGLIASEQVHIDCLDLTLIRLPNNEKLIMNRHKIYS